MKSPLADLRVSSRRSHSEREAEAYRSNATNVKLGRRKAESAVRGTRQRRFSLRRRPTTTLLNPEGVMFPTTETSNQSCEQSLQANHPCFRCREPPLAKKKNHCLRTSTRHHQNGHSETQRGRSAVEMRPPLISSCSSAGHSQRFPCRNRVSSFFFQKMKRSKCATQRSSSPLLRRECAVE